MRRPVAGGPFVDEGRDSGQGREAECDPSVHRRAEALRHFGTKVAEGSVGTVARLVRRAYDLLSQVDASVGGKNGVNLLGYKNIIGVFCQPEFVICDQEMLKTLSTDDLNCGFAEIIKHILIDEQGMFSYLEENVDRALALDLDVIQKLVIHSVETKAGIVNRDERETGERRKLNLGHTFGHAFEKIGHLPHGNAVSLGVVVAANLSVEKGLLVPAVRDRIVALIQRLKLPIKPDFKQDEVIEAMRKDKKRESEHIHFILIKNIGDVVMEKLQMTELNKVKF